MRLAARRLPWRVGVARGWRAGPALGPRVAALGAGLIASQIAALIAALGLLAGCALERGYESQGGVWVYRVSTGNGTWRTPLAGVDGATFEVIDGYFARDAQRVYFHDQVVVGADPARLQVLSTTVARDAQAVYCKGQRLEGSDPGSFRFLAEGYAADRAQVYWQCQRVDGAQAASFHFDGQLWRDRQRVYRLGERVEGINAATLQRHADGIWSQDGQVACVGLSCLKDGSGVDLASFTVIGGVFARDRAGFLVAERGIYPRRMAVRDPASFEVLGRFWARDAQTLYWTGVALPQARREGFVIRNDHTGWDGVHCFVGGEGVAASRC